MGRRLGVSVDKQRKYISVALIILLFILLIIAEFSGISETFENLES